MNKIKGTGHKIKICLCFREIRIWISCERKEDTNGHLISIVKLKDYLQEIEGFDFQGIIGAE